MDKPCEKQKRPHLRKNSHQSPVDAGLRSDELFGSSGLGPASSSSTMQYPTTGAPLPKGPLSAKPSLTKFVNDDHHHPNDTPGKPPPYYEHTSSPRDGYPHRNPSQDQPSSRRSSYGGNDDPPYPMLHNPHRPRSPYHPHQESRPISRQPLFTHQPYLDHEDETDIDRGGRDRERFWDRDDEGGRDVYSEPRRTMTHPHPTPRHSPNLVLHQAVQDLSCQKITSRTSMMIVQKLRLDRQIMADITTPTFLLTIGSIRDPRIALVPRPHVNHRM